MAGLKGRRVALAGPGDSTRDVRERLEGAGALVEIVDVRADARDLRGGNYAALVLVGGAGPSFEAGPGLVQLTREFLGSDKPVAAIGSAQAVVLEAGGAAGRTVAGHAPLSAVLDGAGASLSDGEVEVDGALITARDGQDRGRVASHVAGALASCFEEREVDLMSELSFPASDPPSTSPTTPGADTREPRP